MTAYTLKLLLAYELAKGRGFNGLARAFARELAAQMKLQPEKL